MSDGSRVVLGPRAASKAVRSQEHPRLASALSVPSADGPSLGSLQVREGMKLVHLPVGCGLGASVAVVVLGVVVVAPLRGGRGEVLSSDS